MEKIKVAMVATNLGINGISSVIINYCKNINHNKFQITIFAGKPIDKTYKNICDDLGIKIIELPMRKPTTFQYYYTLFKSIKKGYYDIIHVHGNSSAMYLDLLIGKIKKVKGRIAHCHNAKSIHPIINRLFWKKFQKSYDYGLSCSKKAGNWVFENKFTIVENGFNLDDFAFDKKERQNIRKKINLNSNAIVIGHTGRFNIQKNQKFLVDIFDSLCELNNNFHLLLIGEGPDFEDIKTKVNNLKYKDNVILYGQISNTCKIYSAMDIFAFPSISEGLGISLLEAQINGLPCISSNNVPPEAKITNNVKFCSLDNKKTWINEILKLSQIKKREKIDINNKKIQNFNISNCTDKLERIYIKLLKQKEAK